MDPDLLERLATDRALGGLTPDVERLLDAYLQLDPQAGALAGQVERTVQLAREAVAETQPSSMPAFPVAGFMQIERWQKRVRQLTYAAGLAACLMIGLGLGRLIPTASHPAGRGDQGPIAAIERSVHRPHSLPGAANLVTDVNRVAGGGDGQAGFWSLERLRERRERVRLPASSVPRRELDIQWPFWHRPT